MTLPTIIKICGITDPQLAANAVRLGADYIGIVMNKCSTRYVNMDQAKQIAASVNNASGIPVAVFVDTPANEMIAICNECNINTVQLHGETSRKEHRYLPHTFQRIYVMPVNQDGIPLPDLDSGLDYLDEKRDFILFDGVTGGSGQTFKWNDFKYTGNLPMLVAGGLTPNNVATAMSLLEPSGVDVSSGVEKMQGIKDLELIRKFIKNALKGDNHVKC